MTRPPKGPRASVAWLVHIPSDPSALVSALAPHGKVYLAVHPDTDLPDSIAQTAAAVLRTTGLGAAEKLASLATEDSNAAWQVTLTSPAAPNASDIDRFLKTLGGLSPQTVTIGVEPGLKGVFKNPTPEESRATRTTAL